MELSSMGLSKTSQNKENLKKRSTSTICVEMQ